MNSDKSLHANEKDAEQLIDKIMSEIAKGIESSKKHPFAINTARMREFAMAYNVLLYLSKDEKVSYDLSELNIGIGVLTVSGSKIDITNTTAFAKVAELSTDFEIYSRIDGTVRMNIDFYGLSEPVKAD